MGHETLAFDHWGDRFGIVCFFYPFPFSFQNTQPPITPAMHRYTSLFLLFSFLWLFSFVHGAPYPKFKAQLLHKDNVEACAVGDID